MSLYERFNLGRGGGRRSEERSAAIRYAVAFLLVTLSTLVGLWFRPASYQSPYLVFYAAILISLLYGGLGPGLASTLLAALLVHFFFLPPYGQIGTDLFGLLGGGYFCLSFGLICWLIDTRRRSVEEQVKIQLELLEMMAEPVTIRDERDRIIYWNRGAEIVYGWTSREAIGQSIPELLRTLYPESLTEIKSRLLSAGSWNGELKRTKRDGTAVIVRTNWTLRKASRERFTILEVDYDITESKRVEDRVCLLAQAVENSSELIAITDSEGIVLVVNHALLDATGHKENEVVGNFFGNTVISRNNPPHFIENLLAKTRAGPGWRGECLSHRKDGTDFPTFLSTGQIRDSRGLLIGLYEISQDITERRKAETELRESKDRLQIALEITNMGMWELNLENHIAQRSLRHDQIFGYQSLEPEWSYERLIQHVLPENRAAVHEKFKDSHVTGTLEFDTQIRRVDGEVRWIWARGHNFFNQAGQPTRMFGTVMDITVRKNVEETLRLNEQRLRLAQVAAGFGMFEVEIPSGRRSWSPQMFQIFGLPSDAPPDGVEDSLRFTHPEDRSLVEQQTALLNSGKSVHFEHRIVHPGGDVRWVEIFGTAECDQTGKPIRYLGICKDVTERLQMEAQLRQMQKMEAVGQLAGGVAHDFNNLMGVILGYSDLLADRDLSDEVFKKRLEAIRVAVRSASGVTRQLLAFSRKQVLRPIVLDINIALQNLNKMIGRLISEAIQVELHLEPNPGFVKADPGQIEQVLINLVVNARDAMPEGGILHIETANVTLSEEFARLHIGSRTGDFIKVSVKDNGVGMNKEVMSHIFEPFFTTKEVAKGTGLGLATVYGIVKQSEGYIAVESEPGKGTTFNVYLPRVQSEPASEIPSRAVNVARGSETILLVEDSHALRELTQEQLETMGYRVLTAQDAENALTLFAKEGAKVCLLLTDVVMPGMNGRILGEKLRKLNPHLRILFMTGYTDDEILRSGVSDQLEAILMKPFPRDVLASRIREILDRTPEQSIA